MINSFPTREVKDKYIVRTCFADLQQQACSFAKIEDARKKFSDVVLVAIYNQSISRVQLIENITRKTYAELMVMEFRKNQLIKE